MFRLCAPVLGKGGVFSARVHPRLKQILRGVKQESSLRREAITRLNKRWRSWAIRTVRKHNLARQVVLTADPKLMDAEYLATCMQKAASSGLTDVDLWKGYSDRFCEIVDEIPPDFFRYIVWSVGRVQIPFRGGELYPSIIRRGTQLAPDLCGSSLMAVLWTLRRALVKPPTELLERIAKRLVDDSEKIRPSDFIKIINSLAFYGFGKTDMKFREKISQMALKKFESETFAQDFRSAVDPLAMANMYNSELQVYVLDRFRKIFITARPNHLLQAYHCSVLVRVMAPDVWFSGLSDKTRGFYQSLSVRHISAPSRGMSKLHTEVSDILAGPDFSIPHRNQFRWGPFWIDIGIETEQVSEEIGDDKKTCIILDKPSSFYANDRQRMNEKAMLEDLLLSSVGWKVCHVNHHLWSRCRDTESKVNLLRSVLH